MSKLTVEYADKKFDEINNKLDNLSDKLDEKNEESVSELEFIIEDDEVSYVYQVIPYWLKQLKIKDNKHEIDRVKSLQQYIKKNYHKSIVNIINFYGSVIYNMINYVEIEDVEFGFKINLLKKTVNQHFY